MVFTSHIFVFYFLPITLGIYFLLNGWFSEKNNHWQNFFLLVMSYIFYGWENPLYVFLMFIATLINYIGGGIIARNDNNEAVRYQALFWSVTLSLLMLGFFKYFMFFESNLNYLLNFTGVSPFPVYQVLLPIGISFFIFQSISYTVDVYRRESPPVRSLSDFACFVALFPQLIAGPIVRYGSVAEQIVYREHSLAKFTSGVAIFILGFAKKILLANSVGKVADAVFAAETPGVFDAWWGVTAYAFQIYFDFSAYSDMAVGLGRMIGFEFIRNFNAPYLADSITDFWRRWHISLSTFLRDYLYIPLGGNKGGEWKTYRNLIIVMLLGGLWHGASWVFVIWGAYHGTLLAFERWRGKKSVYEKLPRPVRVAVTFVLVLFSWVLFRAPSLEDALQYFSSLFGLSNVSEGTLLLGGVIYTQGAFQIGRAHV